MVYCMYIGYPQCCQQWTTPCLLLQGTATTTCSKPYVTLQLEVAGSTAATMDDHPARRQRLCSRHGSVLEAATAVAAPVDAAPVGAAPVEAPAAVSGAGSGVSILALSGCREAPANIHKQTHKLAAGEQASQRHLARKPFVKLASYF